VEKEVCMSNRLEEGRFNTDFHPIPWKSRRRHDVNEIASASIVIEDDVWLGGSVTELKGVRIGRGTIIATGAVVTSDIPYLL
jgi:acetyltransferase-like isoleucine patch superfamily enzyme